MHIIENDHQTFIGRISVSGSLQQSI